MMTNPNPASDYVTDPDLLPCPFCGGAAEYSGRGIRFHDSPVFNIGPWWQAGCLPCGIWMPNKSGNLTKAQAAAAWNRRFTDAPGLKPALI